MPAVAGLRDLVKSVLPPQQWRLVRRATNRIRWLLKARLVFHYGFPFWRHPWVAAKYILWDPEVESYTYDLANEDEVAEKMAPALGVTSQQVKAWFEEAKTDPYLSRDRGWHWSSKRRLSLGNRLLYYPVVRALKPRVIVEAGIHEGLASEMFLCALRRNAAEGKPGQLISFDIHQDTGWLVHPDLHAHWQRVIDSTLTGMAPVLKGLEVDLFLHDTYHINEVIAGELDIILKHAGPRLGIVDSSGVLRTTLRDYCRKLGATHYFVADRPKDHIVKSHGVGLAIVERPSAVDVTIHSEAVANATKGLAGTVKVISALMLVVFKTLFTSLNAVVVGL